MENSLLKVQLNLLITHVFRSVDLCIYQLLPYVATFIPYALVKLVLDIVSLDIGICQTVLIELTKYRSHHTPCSFRDTIFAVYIYLV